MRKARRRARQIVQKYNLSTAPIDLYKIIDNERLTLDEWNFQGRVKEVYVGDSIGILQSVSPRKKRELIAHALGHYFLHHGNHVYFDEYDQFAKFRQECQAQCFATELLMPSILLKKVKNLPVQDIADYFYVEEDLVNFFISFLKGKICQ